MTGFSPDWLKRPVAAAAIRAFEAENLPLRFVGGAVRDLLLGRSVIDLDAATPAKPEITLALLEKHGIRAIPTGMAHGTVTAALAGETLEITTLRRDVETDGRHAVVAFTDSWRDDAARRDFTMNALYLAPDGRLFDYFSGREDLGRGRVRFIGEASERIAEDRLRILRFFRFFATHGRPPIDLAALGACEAAVLGLVHLSGERIRREMWKLLAAPDPLSALEAMLQTGVLASVLGTPVSLGRVRALLSNRLADMHGPSAPLRLAALLLDGGDPSAGLAYVVRRWKLSGKEADLLRLLVEHGDDDDLPPVAATARRLIYRHGEQAAHHLLALALSRQPGQRGYLDAVLEMREWRAPRFPVGGDELSAAGIPPGPAMGRALAALETRWIASDFALTRPELLAMLPDLAAEG